MALEPRTITLADEKNPELEDMSRRFWISAALTLPVFTMAMSEMVPGLDLRTAIGAPYRWIQLALATPVVFWGGYPFFERGVSSIVRRKLT